MAFSIGRIIGPAVLGALLSLGVMAAPGVAAAQADATNQDGDGQTKRFNCQDGGTILYRFETQRGQLVAIVDAFDGYGPHTLSSRPYSVAPVQLIWSDGQRTLTWSPGVQIMWMDASVHRMCGGGHHQH